MIPSTVVGSVTGTGADLNVVIGFIPDYVNIAGTNYFLRAGTGNVVAYRGATGHGFTIKAAASTNATVLDYLAIRSGPGAN